MGYGLGDVQCLIRFAVQPVGDFRSRVLIAFQRLLDALRRYRSQRLPLGNAAVLVVFQCVLDGIAPRSSLRRIPIALLTAAGSHSIRT